MKKTILLKLVDLIEDFDLYPRSDVNNHHVQNIRSAIRAGCVLPPIIIDEKSRRIVDGFHRRRAYKAEFGEDYELEVVANTYPSEREMFLDAMRYNSAHGQGLSPFDRARATLRAKALRISTEKIAQALNMTTGAIEKLCANKTGKVRLAKSEGSGTVELIPIKRTIAHMAGQMLNKKQQAVNEKLTGSPAIVHVNELISLIESDLLDLTNDRLLDRLRHLGTLILELPEPARVAG